MAHSKDRRKQVEEYLLNNMDVDLKALMGPDFDIDAYIDANWKHLKPRLEGRACNKLPDWMEAEDSKYSAADELAPEEPRAEAVAVEPAPYASYDFSSVANGPAPLSRLAPMFDALGEVAKLSAAGDIKYGGTDNWTKQDDPEAFCRKRLDSLMRHAMRAAADMHSKDAETKIHHLAATAWNALTILSLLLKGK